MNTAAIRSVDISPETAAAPSRIVLALDDARRVVGSSRGAGLHLLRAASARSQSFDDLVPMKRDEVENWWMRLMKVGWIEGEIALVLAEGIERRAVYHALANATPGVHVVTFFFARMVNPTSGATASPAPSGVPSERLGRVLRHELRGPMATALMYLRLVERGLAAPAPPELERAIVAATRYIRELDCTASRMIDLHENRPLKIEKQPACLARIVVETVWEPREDATARAEDVRLDVPPTLPGAWDASAVVQIVRILIAQARARGRGGPIHLSMSAIPGGALLSIRNQAPAVAAAEQRSFVDDTAGKGADGPGLELWIVQVLARAHGGDMTLVGGRHDEIAVHLAG